MTLGYCMNVHPGETLAEVLAALRGPVRRARELAGGPMGVGLYLSAAATHDLYGHRPLRERIAELREAVQDAGVSVFTANAFPFGGFHAERVKETVYRPTWWEGPRYDFTRVVAEILAALLPEGGRASISTLPICYRALAPRHLDVAGGFLGSLAADLEGLARKQGRELALAIEPEPLCVIERASELVSFLEEHVFAGAGRAAIERRFPGEDAEAIARRRIGACLDTAHHAVVFEPLPEALETYRSAGVRVVKAQLSSALELAPARNTAGVARLRSFDEPRYLHQTFFADAAGRELGHVADIGEAFPRGELDPAIAAAALVRTHCHVPLAWGGDPELGTTRPLLERALPAIAAATSDLEIETYTWSVLPAATRAHFGDDVAAMVAAELAWVRSRLRPPGA